jgi:hypothetical protein
MAGRITTYSIGDLRKSEPDVSSNLFVVQSDIQFLRTNCLEGRNLCTPAESLVDQAAPGYYHVVLPAHLEWGASIPNPDARAVEITNLRGMICQNPGSGDSEECSGPSGLQAESGKQNTSPLLDPVAKSGALIAKTQNRRTWFSVNGRRGRHFTQNEGFFEFDVRQN